MLTHNLYRYHYSVLICWVVSLRVACVRPYNTVLDKQRDVTLLDKEDNSCTSLSKLESHKQCLTQSTAH